MLADVGATLLWEEPVSAAYNAYQQNRAADQLAEIESEFDASEDPGSTNPAEVRRLAKRFEGKIENGDPIGRLKVPSIGLNVVLMNGTDTGTLQKGPGRYPQTALPGFGETTGIAGHRTTYAAPLRKINEIEDGTRSGSSFRTPPSSTRCRSTRSSTLSTSRSSTRWATSALCSRLVIPSTALPSAGLCSRR